MSKYPSLDDLEKRLHSLMKDASSLDPESIAGTPAPRPAWRPSKVVNGIGFEYDKDGNPVMDAYEVFDPYDSDDKPKVIKKFIYSGIIKASYTGMNQVEQIKKYVEGIVATDSAAARIILNNLYINRFKNKYPKLEHTEISCDREWDPVRDKEITLTVKDKPKFKWGSE